MDDNEFLSRFRLAVENVRALDEADGFEDRSLRTIATALEAGLRNPGTNAQFDAFAMLVDLCDKVQNGGVAHV